MNLRIKSRGDFIINIERGSLLSDNQPYDEEYYSLSQYIRHRKTDYDNDKVYVGDLVFENTKFWVFGTGNPHVMRWHGERPLEVVLDDEPIFHFTYDIRSSSGGNFYVVAAYKLAEFNIVVMTPGGAITFVIVLDKDGNVVTVKCSNDYAVAIKDYSEAESIYARLCLLGLRWKPMEQE